MLKKKLSRSLFISALGLVLTLGPAYSAVLQTYDSSTQSVFNALIQPAGTIGFDDQLAGPNSWKSTTLSSGYSITVNGSTVQFVGFDSSSTYDTVITWYPDSAKDWGTGAVLSTNVPNPDPNRHLHIALPGGATAIGLNLMSIAGYGPYTSGAPYNIKLSTGDVLGPISTAAWSSVNSLSPNLGNVAPSWFGLTSDTPITWIDLQTPGASMMIDNFQFGTAQAGGGGEGGGDTPEAATMVLIGTGLAALRFLRKFSNTRMA